LPALLPCWDLATVSKSVDDIVDRFGGRIDFLVHTGNLCLEQKSIFSSLLAGGAAAVGRPTSQGYDGMFGGNFMSAFLITEKLLPHLELSKYGTIVQFTSPIAAGIGDRSRLEVTTAGPINSSSVATTTDNGRKGGGRPPVSVQISKFATLLSLPVQLATVKLAERFLARTLARTYPNIRVLEIPRRWWWVGPTEATAFFDRIFERELDGNDGLLSPTSCSDPSEDEIGLQDDLYLWCQDATRPWFGRTESSRRRNKHWSLGWPSSGMGLFASSSSETAPATVASRPLLEPARTFLVGSAVALAALTIKEYAWNREW
jgi:NAD(P)-dependent dehydrogenase (short-subunit alcohol dehydrogenase family)